MANPTYGVIGFFPDFTGEASCDFEQWLINFEMVSWANGWDNSRKASVLPAFLKTRAADKWNELPVETQANWNSVTNALKEKFVPKGMASIYAGSFCTRTQGKHERVEQYVKSLRKLAVKAFPGIDNLDHLIKDRCINGLRCELKRPVLMLKPSTLYQAEAVAIEQERNEQMCFGTAPWSVPQSIPSSETISATAAVSIAELTEVKLDMEQLANAITEIAETNLRVLDQDIVDAGNPDFDFYRELPARHVLICNYCGTVGHQEAYCWGKAQDEDSDTLDTEQCQRDDVGVITRHQSAGQNFSKYAANCFVSDMSRPDECEPINRGALNQAIYDNFVLKEQNRRLWERLEETGAQGLAPHGTLKPVNGVLCGPTGELTNNAGAEFSDTVQN